MPNAPRPDNPPRAIRICDELWHRVLSRAETDGQKASEVVREALRRYLK